MVINADNILLIGAILLLISVLAGKAINKLGVPTLIFFLIVGILAGSEGVGGIYFDNAALAQFIGIVALNFILFSGGLDTNWQSIKPVLWPGMALSTNGSTILQENDIISVLAEDKKSLEMLSESLGIHQ